MLPCKPSLTMFQENGNNDSLNAVHYWATMRINHGRGHWRHCDVWLELFLWTEVCYNVGSGGPQAHGSYFSCKSWTKRGDGSDQEW